MIKNLRFKMVLICSSVTASILTIVCLIGFSIFNSHYQKETKATLELQLNNLVFCLKQQRTISHTYLSELQAQHHLLIHIEDNGTPILFHNLMEPKEVQQQLFEQAWELATNTYNFNISPFHLNSLNLPTVYFHFEGVNHKPYLAALTLLPIKSSKSSIILLKDLTSNHTYILYIKLLFIGLVIGGTLLLVLFSFGFVEMLLKPIKENNQKQAEFIAAASHELRAPLTVIEAGLSSIENNVHNTSPTSSAHFIKLMQNECIRMKRLISDLLTLARSDAHQWYMQFSKVEIDALLIDLYDSFYSLCRDKQLTLYLKLPDELLPSISCDTDRIKQALTILLDNALSYVPANRSITLTAFPTAKTLDIQVIDTGIGIKDEDKTHIFERFYQGDRSRHTKNHYGLGLSIAHEIAQLHHGTLSLTDTPGGGCTFTLSLPYLSNTKIK